MAYTSSPPTDTAANIGRELFAEDDDLFVGSKRDTTVANNNDDDDNSNEERPSFDPSVAPRRITVQLDPEDQLIWNLKAANYSDTIIANRLAESGFTKYKPPSIASRYRRIVQKLQEKTDELLEADLTDWHEGEDDILQQAYARAEARIEAEIQASRNNLFHYTSLGINNKIDTPRYSAQACKNRLESLKNGTARPPPELSDNPEAYAQELIARKEEYFHQKTLDQQRQAQAAAAAKTQTPAALAEAVKKVAQDQKKAEAAAKKAAIQAEKDLKNNAQQEFVRRREDTKQAHRDEERAKQSEGTRDRRILRILQRNYEEKQKDDEAMAAQERTEERRRATLPTSLSGHPTPRPQPRHDFDDDSMDDFEARDQDTSFSTPYHSTNPTSTSSPYANPTPPSNLPNTPSALLTTNPDVPTPYMLPRPSAPPGPALPSTAHIDVSEDASLDPREIMAKPELMNLVIERGMSKNREKETKALLTRRLRESDRMASLGELHAWLRRRGLSTRGNRAELVWRLQEYDARMSRAWRPKHMATLRKSREAVRKAFGKMDEGGQEVMPRAGRFGVSAGGVPLARLAGYRESRLLEGGVRETIEGRGSVDGSDGLSRGFVTPAHGLGSEGRGYSTGRGSGSESRGYGDEGREYGQRGSTRMTVTPGQMSGAGIEDEDDESLFMVGQQKGGAIRGGREEASGFEHEE
ncbi:Hypothetical protein D9617_10g072240 [Elsinoe fawcettii]|nr:Hypothetical protein D9617_10g072240 [Elsinoe fawcettii]